MKREELPELHFISPIANVPSILKLGILCHNRALGTKIQHADVSMPEIQEKRSEKKLPNGRLLHDYANVYICARNPMMFKRKDQHLELAVLRISVGVLDRPGVIVADQNAASGYALFAPAESGLGNISFDTVFAERWTHPDDQIAEWRHKSQKCAEVLVPKVVPPEFITGAYVSCNEASELLTAICPHLAVTIDPHLFFRGGA